MRARMAGCGSGCAAGEGRRMRPGAGAGAAGGRERAGPRARRAAEARCGVCAPGGRGARRSKPVRRDGHAHCWWLGGDALSPRRAALPQPAGALSARG
jgi:hypothetical protein